MTRLPRRSALLLPLAAGGCSVYDEIFGESKDPLPGKRESVAVSRRGLVKYATDTRTVSVPAPSNVPTWPQPGGGPTHVVGNVAIAGFNPAWRASVGSGGGYRRKITAQPIVIPGRVVAMDSDGQISAFETGTGNRIWRTATQGEDDRSTNVGGGLSFADGLVFASTGRAELMALDAGSGAIKWRQSLGAPARSAPTVAEGKLFTLTLDDRLLCFTVGGERQWSYQASTVATTLLGQAAPAYSDGLVVAGFGSGDLAAVRADSGGVAWSDSLAASRGRNTLVDISAIRALPVVDRGRIFAIGAGGFLVSLDLRSGRRLWERDAGGSQTPWLAGDWLFVQTLEQTLAAIGREDGRVRWLTELPDYNDQEKRRDPILWNGPVLAAGKLILTGTNSMALSVDPATGNLLGRIELRDAAATPPVVADGTLLVLTDDGTLAAYR